MKKLVKLLLSVIIVLMCTSCGSVRSYMAYTVYPIGYLLERIGGNKIQPISVQTNTLVTNANIVSNYEEILKDSSFFFHIAHFEPYMDLYEEEIDACEAGDVDLSILNVNYDFKRYSLVYHGDTPTFVEEDYYKGDVFKDIDMLDKDYYLWLDPIGMLSMAKDVYETLSRNYVEEADYFKANYTELYDDLISLDAKYQSLATKLRNESKTIKFVSMTASFGNWQKDYGFQVYPVCLSRYGAVPSEAQLEIIKERILRDEVKYIVYEPNMSSDMEALFVRLESELGLRRVILSNISSLTPSQISDGKDYLSLMKDNLAVLENMAELGTGE